MFCSNILAYNVAILQQTITIVELINKIYAAIENNEEVIKVEKFELLDLATYFINRKYYINRHFNFGSLNFIYNKSFSLNNDF